VQIKEEAWDVISRREQAQQRSWSRPCDMPKTNAIP
jgi:hypothetical protein